MKKINLMMWQGLLLSALALGFVACEPSDKPCPNKKEADGDTSQGVTVMLEMEDVVTGETTRTVLGESNYNFTPVNGGGDVEVYGLGFYRKQGQGDDIDVDLTYYAKENVVFQGWSWRYGDDPVGTAWGKKEGEKGYVSTPAIQAKSGVQKLELGKDATKFTCQYRPNADNTVYVKVKYVKVDPSKATYHWDVKGPLQGAFRTGFPYFGLIRHRRPEIFIVDSYVTIEGMDTAFEVYPIVKMDDNGFVFPNFYFKEPSRLGRFYVTFLHSECLINDKDIQYNWAINQDPNYKKYLGYSEERNASGILTIPRATARDLVYGGWNGNHVVIRFDMNYDCVASIRNMWNGFVKGNITVQFAYTNGYTTEKKYEISLSDVERDNPKLIDFLPDVITCTPVSTGDLSVGLKYIKLIESKCELTFTDHQGVKKTPPKQTWFDFMQ